MTTSQDTEEFAALRAAAQHGPLYTVGRATAWSIAPAFHGAGTVVVGPADHPSDGTVAVTPPGVWSRTPDGASAPVDRDGWRLSEWASGRMIDEHRPIGVKWLSLEDAHRFVSERFPEGVSWMERLVCAQIQQLLSAPVALPGLEEDRDADQAYAAMLQLDAAAVFGRQVYVTSETEPLEALATRDWPSSSHGHRPALDLHGAGDLVDD